MMWHSHEYLAELAARRPRKPHLLEGWRGTQIVTWYGSIERQLVSLQREAAAAENKEAEAKLYAYLKVWRDNELTGSVNVETVKALKAGADVLAVDQWSLGNYFSQLRDQLRRLMASLEELPAGGFDAEAAASFGPRSGPLRLEPPSSGGLPDMGEPGDEGGGGEEPAGEEGGELPPEAVGQEDLGGEEPPRA